MIEIYGTGISLRVNTQLLIFINIFVTGLIMYFRERTSGVTFKPSTMSQISGSSHFYQVSFRPQVCISLEDWRTV